MEGMKVNSFTLYHTERGIKVVFQLQLKLLKFYFRERSHTTSDREKNQLQHNLYAPEQQHTRRGGFSDPQLTS